MRRQLIIACWSYIPQILVYIVHSPIMAGCGQIFSSFLNLTLNFSTINLPILNSIFSFIPRKLRPQFTSRKIMVAVTVFVALLQRCFQATVNSFHCGLIHRNSFVVPCLLKKP